MADFTGPSNLYNNKSLAAQEAKRKLSVEVEEPTTPYVDPYADEPTADQLLKDAHGSLDRASALEAIYDTSGISSIEDRMAQLSATKDSRGTLRKVFDGRWAVQF